MGRAGFPILEVGEDAEAIVTKLPGTGGRIDQWTVKEHLVYEVGDPRRYLMPDAVADFTSLRLADDGMDRVRVSGVRGEVAPDLWKLVVGYQDGWIGETMAFFPWPYAYDRAVKARETLLERFERMGLAADQIHFDFIGLPIPCMGQRPLFRAGNGPMNCQWVCAARCGPVARKRPKRYAGRARTSGSWGRAARPSARR